MSAGWVPNVPERTRSAGYTKKPAFNATLDEEINDNAHGTYYLHQDKRFVTMAVSTDNLPGNELRVLAMWTGKPGGTKTLATWHWDNTVNVNGQPPASILAHDSGAVVLVDSSQLSPVPSVSLVHGNLQIHENSKNNWMWSKQSNRKARGHLPLTPFREVVRNAAWRLQFKGGNLHKTLVADMGHFHRGGIQASLNNWPTLLHVLHSNRYYLVSDVI